MNISPCKYYYSANSLEFGTGLYLIKFSKIYLLAIIFNDKNTHQKYKYETKLDFHIQQAN